MAEEKKPDTWLGMMLLLVVILLVAIILLPTSGCGTVNGLGADTENLGRVVREATQPAVDNMGFRRIASGVEEQNRLIRNGQQMSQATR